MRHPAWGLAAASIAAIAAQSASAQQSAPAPAPEPAAPASGPGQAAPAAGLEEILVTAQRRSERLQDVPVAVTAFGERDLARRQIVDLQALASNTPSLNFTSTFYGNNDLVLAIRGVAPGGILPNVDQAVGTYVDGLYYARPEGSNFALVDVASAEVLRGPQGTLFGRNTIAGALNITTNKPTYRFEGSAKLSYGNYDALGATGIVNVPIVDDRLAARLVYSHVQHDGYGYNPGLKQDVADQNDDFVRLSLRGDMTEKLRADISVDYYDGRNHPPLWKLAYYTPGVSPAALAPYVDTSHSRTSQAGYNPVNHSKVYDVTSTFSADFGWATGKWITGYRHVDYEGATDLDATPLPSTDLLAFDLTGRQWSQEIQLSGKSLDNRLTWVGGFYFFDEKFLNSPISRVSGTISDNTLRPHNQSMSAFAQFTYEILPRLRVTGGLRYVHDTRGMVYTPARYTVAAAQAGLVSPPPESITAAACPFTAIGLNQNPGGCLYRPSDVHFNYVPFTAGLDYKLGNDGLLYGKVARGFRSGGFQQASGTTRAFYTPFGDENVMSYEIGAKLSLLDRHLRLGLAGYLTNYNDVQQNAVLSAAPVIIAVLNAGKERIYGGEFEATALIGALRLSGSLGLIEPKFTSGPYIGSKVPTVAKTNYAVSADLPIRLNGAGTLNLHADYNYKSTVYFYNTVAVTATGVTPYNASQIAMVRQKGYGLLNGQISYDLPNMPVTIAVFGKNLTNRFYAGRTGSFYNSSYNSIVVGDPRTYGVSAAYRF
ncbi:MAG: TonB-dependent receptor [Sphingobium sp.]|nr:TonB-dependent receptor [Sphingobium sp.]